MKATSLLFAIGSVAAICSSTALALTINVPVNAAYVREHPKEWSVEVTKGKDNLIHFTVRHNVETPMYHVAHLAVYHQGRLVTTSDTPSFGKKRGNNFYFSLSAEDIAESTFNLSQSALSGTGDDAVPVVGSTVYELQLLDFVPRQLLESTPGR